MKQTQNCNPRLSKQRTVAASLKYGVRIDPVYVKLNGHVAALHYTKMALTDLLIPNYNISDPTCSVVG
jgi:hypothetical protein